MRDAESGGRRVWRRGWVGSAGDAGGRRVGGDAGGRRVGGDAGGRRVGGGAGDSSVATSGVGLTGLAGYRAGGDGGGRRVGGGAGDEGSAVGEATSGVGLTGLAGYRVRGGGGRHAGYRVGRARRVRHFLAARLVTIMVCALGGSTAAGAPAIESAPGTVHAEVVSERGHKVPGEEGAGGVTTFSERTDGTAMTTPDGTTTTPVSEGTVTATIRELAALRATDKDADASERYISSLPAEIIEALGYAPVIVDGLPADPEGDCSSPVPLPASFTPACLTHDLGYDLLRIADAAGEQIPGGVRLALDEQLGEGMVASCGGDFLSRTSCQAAASVAESAVRVNSWRQRGGAPVAENWPWT